MDVTVKELARLIELNKKKAELEFRESILAQENISELKNIAANAAEIAKKAKNAGIDILLPKQKSLDRLSSALAAFSAEEIKNSLKTKDGEPYRILMERGAIVKENYENRLEIAKLCMMMVKLKLEDQNKVKEALQSGAIAETLTLANSEEPQVDRLARHLRRCGIRCVAAGRDIKPVEDAEWKNDENRFDLSGKTIWITDGTREELERNIANIKQMNAMIQLKNAERQIRSFSEDEEKEFEGMQKEYLNLLKAQDELLEDFNSEEKIN